MGQRPVRRVMALTLSDTTSATFVPVQDQLDDPAAVLAHGGLHRAVNAGGHRFNDLIVVDHRRAGPDGPHQLRPPPPGQ